MALFGARTIAVVVAIAALPVVFDAQQSSAPATAPTHAARDGDPVDLGTGLYIRRSIDIILTGPAPLVFSRVYRNRDSRSRPFGIGTNHSFGSFLVGDAALSYIDLILPDGARVHYRRTAGRIGHVGGVFEHTTSPGEYRGSRLLWNGSGWTIKLLDGSVSMYPDCFPSLNKPCTMSVYRDAKGHAVRVRHDRRMNAVRLQADEGPTIELTYDDLDRIVLARSSTGQEVRYRYDSLGRLTHVSDSAGSTSTYGYDPAHQMVQVKEPGISIHNAFDSGGRCIVNDVKIEVAGQKSGRTRRSLFKFEYTVNPAGKIMATVVQRASSRRRVTFNEAGYALSDTVTGGKTRGFGTAVTREAGSNAVQRVTLWCGADKVETAVDPDASMNAIRQIVERACRRLGKN